MPTPSQMAGIAILVTSLCLLGFGFLARSLWKRFGFRFMRAHLRAAKTQDAALTREKLELVHSFDDPLDL